MADVMSAEKRSALMSRIRSSNTGPEMVLRKALWARGFRYRLDYRIGRIRPYVVFVTPRLAVFVDGCFWHRCPLHGVMPKGNRSFWQTKLQRNVQRDAETNQTQLSTGWITTSYINKQAYQEVVDEGHPVIFVTVIDIVRLLRTAGYGGKEQVSMWLDRISLYQ